MHSPCPRCSLRFVERGYSPNCVSTLHEDGHCVKCGPLTAAERSDYWIAVDNTLRQRRFAEAVYVGQPNRNPMWRIG